MKDKCLDCGKSLPPELWGAKCPCGGLAVHVSECSNGCGNYIGYLIDDDYCGPEKIICAHCLGGVEDE